MNIHLPAILMFTRGTRFWHTDIYIYMGPFPVIHGYYQHGCVVFGFGGSLFSDKAKIDLINYTHLNSQ